MLGKYICTLSNIASLIFLLLFLFQKNKKWLLCLGVAGIISIYSIFVPIENLFYTFPTPDDVAQYSCEGEVIKIIDGQESSLILYSTSPGNIIYMLSNKTADGYKIGSSWGTHRYTILHPQAPIQMIESKNGIDKYVYTFGTVAGDNFSINDSQANSFFAYSSPAPILGQTVFIACSIMKSPQPLSYEITISSSQETFDVNMVLQSNGKYSLAEND